jgi:hypothetical protein
MSDIKRPPGQWPFMSPLAEAPREQVDDEPLMDEESDQDEGEFCQCGDFERVGAVDAGKCADCGKPVLS